MSGQPLRAAARLRWQQTVPGVPSPLPHLCTLYALGASSDQNRRAPLACCLPRPHAPPAELWQQLPFNTEALLAPFGVLMSMLNNRRMCRRETGVAGARRLACPAATA